PGPASAPAPEALPAMASTLSSAGERALVMARPLRGGGVELVQALISDVEGVVELRVGDNSRGAWRKILKEALEQGGTVELPQHEAAALLAEARAPTSAPARPSPPAWTSRCATSAYSPRSRPSCPHPSPRTRAAPWRATCSTRRGSWPRGCPRSPR
ncbi:hypothetical protein ACLESD_49670, partial [Pyxidicoccus sp. 3LFB2]